MELDLFFERHYPHPIEAVWKAITTADLLERWLMPNDFEARVGHRCVFRFCPPDEDRDQTVHVTVAELDPPRFMRWRWRNQDEQHATTVTFELESSGDGTTLRLRHSGEVSPSLGELLAGGWPSKLQALEDALPVAGM